VYRIGSHLVITDYIVLSAGTPEILTADVRRAISSGLEPLGPAFFAPAVEKPAFCQTMIKRKLYAMEFDEFWTRLEAGGTMHNGEKFSVSELGKCLLVESNGEVNRCSKAEARRFFYDDMPALMDVLMDKWMEFLPVFHGVYSHVRSSSPKNPGE
jgi:hypothetical protein